MYQCPAPPSSSVLILNTFDAPNTQASVPILTDLNGNVNSNISFEIEDEVYAYHSCGVQFKGNFYIYGSEKGDRRQIAKVSDCSLRRIGTLPFDHKFGSCAANANQLFLCFDLNTDGKSCHVSNEPTGSFDPLPKSTEMHFWTRSAASESECFCILGKD